MIGTTLSHYRVLEKIGEGGMGVVYLAEDLKLGRKVAVKVLPEALTSDPGRRERFLQEARAAAFVEHPHIAAVHEVDEVDGRIFIAMEYVRGRSLRQLSSAGPVPMPEALSLASQVAEALAKAHDQGVVHRDIKPENILVSDDGYAKVVDFGLAKSIERGADRDADAETASTATWQGVEGTVAYMSPEQARGELVDARTDIFSFGVVLHELLTGTSPFRRSSMAETLSAILKEPAPPLRIADQDAPPFELERLLTRALAKNLSDRYQSMKDLAVDLRRLLDQSRSQNTTSVSARPQPFGRTWRIGAALAVLALVIVVVYLLNRAPLAVGIGASGRPAIAVLPFQNPAQSQDIGWLGAGLPTMIVTGLAQTSGLDVVSAQRLNEIVEQVRQQNPQAAEPSVIAEVSKRTGAGAVVSGTIFQAGSEIRVDVQVEDVGSGRVIAAHSARGDDVFQLADELSSRIRTSVRLADPPEGRSVAAVTTTSPEAYRLFVEGLEAFRHLRYVDSRLLLEQAVEADPSFALASHYLSIIADRVGEPAVSREWLRKALDHVDRLPPRQKLFVQADDRVRAGRPQESAALLEQLIAQYPDEEAAYHMLSIVYGGHLRQPEKSLSTVERGVRAVPSSGSLRNLYGYQLLFVGRYDEALREFEEYARLDPREPNPYDSQGEVYLITGRPEKALDLYARAIEIDPTFMGSNRGRALAFGMLGQYDAALVEAKAVEDESIRARVPRTESRFVTAFILSRIGRHREAEEEILKGIGETEALQDVFGTINFDLLGALMALERHDDGRALERVKNAEDNLAKASPDLGRMQLAGAYLLAGTIYARAGKLEAARDRRAAQQKLLLSLPEEKWLHGALQGEIALASGDLSGAQAAYLSGEPARPKMWFSASNLSATLFVNNLPMRDGPVRVKRRQGDLAGAIEGYGTLLRTGMANKWTSLLEPRYVLELARLHDELGQPIQAREEYARFLDLWKNADRNLPEVAEATKRLARP